MSATVSKIEKNYDPDEGSSTSGKLRALRDSGPADPAFAAQLEALQTRLAKAKLKSAKPAPSRKSE